MRRLNNAFFVLSILLLYQVKAVSAEPVMGGLPETFPGSGGFPVPAMPSDLPPAYPDWPEPPPRPEIIPPPPGGPYMSSAMTEITVFPEDTGGLRHEAREQQVGSPFFSADMPWPETPERDRPRPWMPESGEYNYVPEEVVRQLESPSSVPRYQHPMHRPYPRYPPPPVRQPYYGYY